VKPEHLLVDPAGSITVVDWEAAYRGPATLDEADIVFRVIREVAYGDLELTAENLALLPWTHTHVAALSWRLVLWLDRRHDTLTDPVVALVEQITELSSRNRTWDAVAAIMQTARTVSTAY
jgi:hypothetical protein